MSYDIRLVDAETRETLLVNHHTEGGTIATGGTNDAEMSITYNYAEVYHLVNDENGEEFSIWNMNNKAAAETIATLQSAVDILGTSKYRDYWAPTPGNAGHAASVLLAWAKRHPNGIWEVQ